MSDYNAKLYIGGRAIPVTSVSYGERRHPRVLDREMPARMTFEATVKTAPYLYEELVVALLPERVARTVLARAYAWRCATSEKP
jgi:hypothetical protein